MYDLIMIGGGPSGSTAGMRAAMRGLNVLVIEKDRFPRYKPCAGGLTRRGMDYLDFELPDNLKEKEIYGMRLCAGERAIESRTETPMAVTVTRSAFDTYLLMKAAETGAEIKMEEKATGVDEKGDYVEITAVKGSYRARYVLLTEGAQGLVMRHMGERYARDACSITMVTEIEANNDEIDTRLPGMFEIHLDISCNGYGWVFPHNGYYSVGIWGEAQTLPDPKGTMKRFLKNAGFEGSSHLRGRVIPMKGRYKGVIGSRVLLSGDAAGFVDPFSGEGIPYAVRSGQIAADLVADVIQKKRNIDSIDDYRIFCKSAFARNFRYARMVAATVYRFPSFFVDLFAADRSIYERFLRVPAVNGRYLDYLVWLIPRLPQALFLRCLKNYCAHGIGRWA